MESQNKSDGSLPSEERLRNYNLVVDSAELVSVQLIKSSFDVKAEFFSVESSKKKLGYDVDVESVDFSQERGVALAVVSFAVHSKKNNKKLLSCAARYIVMYDNLSGCEPGAVDAFVRRVATFASYPYFRTHVAGMDWAATTRLPPLPVLREPARKTS